MYAEDFSNQLQQNSPARPQRRPVRDRLGALKRTGAFLHRPEDIRRVSFALKDGDKRSFTLLVAVAQVQGATHVDRNGICIIDNDSRQVICEGFMVGKGRGGGASSEQIATLDRVADMGWLEFSEFCRSCPSYRGNLSDECRDNRDDFLKGLDGVEGYRFPRTTREGMISEILAHSTWTDASGRKLLAWDIRMNFPWDKSGRVEGGEELCRSQDSRWKKAVEGTSKLFRKACEKTLKPFLDTDFHILDGEEDLLCDLDVAGSHGGWLVLRALGGQDLRMKSSSELAAFLAEASDAVVRNIWATLRALNVDLSRKNRVQMMSWTLNEMRAELESVWLEELDPELDF